MSDRLYPFRGLEWRQYFHQYTTPRDWKRGARDIPFGLGAKTLYVDGTNGNDHNDGLSWKTALKTIQHAIDEADSWTNIFIKAATYSENVSIPSDKSSLSLVGERSNATIIKPSSGKAIFVEAIGCTLGALTAIGNGEDDAGIYISNHYCSVNNIFVGNQNNLGPGLIVAGENAICDFVKINQSYKPKYGIRFESKYGEIKNSIIENVSGNGISLGELACYWNKVHDNTIIDAGEFGIYLYGMGCKYNIVYHNNFIGSGTSNVKADATENTLFENYYDDHSNIDNGFGIATEPYSFSGGSDPRPVICRNGWLGLGVSGKIIKSSPSTGTYTHPNDTNEHDVLEFSADTQDIFISLDVSALTQTTQIREYEKVDGTNYRQISLKTYPDDFDSGTEIIYILFKQKNRDYKVTLQSTVAEGAERSIPYVYRLDGKV